MAKKLRLTDEAVRAGRKKYDESGATVPFPITSESGYNGYTIADKGKQYGISDQQAFRIESYRKKLEGYDWKKNYEYDNLDDEDVRRRQKGLIPKSLQKKYDLDDPVDVALYRNGLPARSIIDSQIKKAETEREKWNKSVRPEFIEEVREGAEKLMRQEARKHAIYRLLHGIPSEGKQAISLPLGVGKSKGESDANTWAAQQEAWQKQYDEQYAPLLGNPSDPAWAQRVQRGSMMELPEIMQRGNVSFTKSAHAISSNPYYISDEDKYWDYFTQDERNIFNYLMAESREKALEFYEFMKPNLSERFTQEEARRASEWAQEDPFWANMGSVAAASVEGLRAAPYALKQGLTGEVNDPYSAANALIAARDSVYSTTEDAIESDPLRMLYAAAYASGESLSRRGADLILPGAGTGLAALSGFARGSRDATMRGATPTEALLSGAGGAAIEGVLEKIGGDRFFKQLGKLGTSTGKDVLIQTMRSILAEGLEEGASGLIEPLFDWLVMGDKSNLVTAYNQRIDAGAKPKQAFRETFLHDYLAEAGEQALVGGLSGGMMGGVATGINTAIQNREAGRSIRETGPLPEFLQEAVAEGAITAEQAQQKMSDFKVGSIVAKQQAKFNAETEGELAKTVPDKAAQKALARAVYGEEISRRQVKKIAANDAAKEAYLRLTGQEIDARMNPRSVTASLVNKQFYRASDEDARVMEATAEKLGNPEIAKIMTANFSGDTDAATYANAFERYYKGMQTGLTTEQIDEAMGDMRKDVLPAAAKMAISNLVAPKVAPDGDFWSMDEAQRREYGKTLSVGLNRRDTAKKLTRIQEIQLKALDIVAKKIGVKLVTHDSINNNFANGAYDPVSNTIHFALNAESDAFVGVSMHEMTHYIRQWNKAGYKVYEKVVLDALSEKADYDLEAEIAKVMEEQNKDRDRAIEEIVSNSSAAILSDEKLVKRLLEEDRSVVEKIRDFFKELLDTIKTTIASLSERDNWKEIKALKDDAETLEKMYNLFNAALNDAAQVAQTENALSVSASDADYAAEAAERGVAVSENMLAAKDEKNGILFSYKTMKEDKEDYRKMLADAGILTAAETNELFSVIDEVMTFIDHNQQAREVLDFGWDMDSATRPFTPVKPNSDPLYKVSLDFSTSCRKRIMQQIIAGRLEAALERSLTKEEGIAVRDQLIKLRNEGLSIQVACALCYVESARMKGPAQIQKFLNNRRAVLIDYMANKAGGGTKERIKTASDDAYRQLMDRNATDKDGNPITMQTALKQMRGEDKKFVQDAKRAARAAYTPSAEEAALIEYAEAAPVTTFTTAEGLETLAANYPLLYDAYSTYLRNATHSKGLQSDTPFKMGDSLAASDSIIAKMNKENGLRTQSWSDFQTKHLLDYVAAIIELSTRNAKMHAYTKVPEYVRLMGKTGQMINLSLIPKRDFKGKLEFDSYEGIDYEESLRLRDEFPETAGTIAIGISDDQIRMLLADETIDYVIPYHASGMNAETRRWMNIPKWKDYQGVQGERQRDYSNTVRDENYRKKPAFSDWFDIKDAKKRAAELKKTMSPMEASLTVMREAAQKYIDVCHQRGLQEKFADYVGEENYWKLLIDRKMINHITGDLIEQKAVKPIFDRGNVLDILIAEEKGYEAVRKDIDRAVKTVLDKFADGTIAKAVESESLRKRLQKIDDAAVARIVEESSQIKFSRKAPDEKELRKQLQSVKRFVPDYMANPKDVKAMTDMIRKQYSATIPRDVLNQRLMRAAEQLHRDGDLETMLSTVSAIASDVVDSARVKDKDALEIYNHYAELRNHFRGEAGFSLTEEQQQEVASVYGSVQDFRKANMGRFIVRNDAASLDAQWEELSTMWPELFDPDTNAADQPIVLAAAMEAMFKKPDQINPYEAEKDAAKADLTFNLTNLLGLVSEADFGAKLKARENELKSQHEAQLAQAQAELSDARMRAAERISELENRLEMAEADSNAAAERREANLRAVAKDLRRQLVSARKAYDRLSTVTAARFIRMQNLMDTRITRAEDRAKRVRARQQTRMYRARIERNVNELSAMLLKPDDARHIPEELRTTIGSFLRQIDVSESVTTLKNMWPAALRKLEAAIPEAEAWEFDLDPDMVVRIQNLLNEQGRIDAAGLNVAQLRELDMLIRDVKNLALKANKALAKGRSETIKELGDKTIAELSQKKRRTRHGSIAKLLTTDMLDATSFADDLGETGASIIRSLRKGFDVKVRDIAIAEKAISEILKGHKIKNLVKEKHEIKIDGNRKIELTTAQCMELYLLSKRERALDHILGDGIRLGDNDKADTYAISREDLSSIIGELTDEQKSLADALQRFVSTTVTEWGNETSMRMYGYKKFGEKNYWPIRTDKNTVSSNGLDQKNMDAAGFYRLKNLGTTQATKDGARNALHVNDVFDTLTSHINEISSYHAFVAPLSDATRWYNYRPKKGPSVKQALEMTLGKEAQGYIENLLKDINSAKVFQRGTDIGDKMIQRARVASVGANFRVVIQQGTAWMRAAAVIDPKYLAASTAMKPNIKRMLEYCPIAQWKAFGFYDLDIGPSLRGLLLKDDGVGQKLQDKSLALAGFADSVTWAGIYNACYLEQKALHPELAGDKEALYRLAGDRLSEVVDRTQVVDSPFHRPDIMRAKNTYMREVTAFMSEPMKSYNLLRSAVVSGDKKRIARTASTFALTAVVTALAESAADAWRDDGKDSFWEKVKAAFLPGDWDENTKWYTVLSEVLGANLVGNLNPANLFPFLRDAMSILEGFETERSDMSSVTRLLSVAKSIVSYLNGTGTKSKWDIAESAAQVISYATGMPFGNAVREVRDLVNKIIPGALE